MKIGVIGCGYWGKNLIRNFYELKVLAAVADVNASLSVDFAKQYQVDALSIDALIDDDSIEAIAIATPAITHAQLTVRILQAGKHVFVEKPLALNLQEAERVKTVVNLSGKKLMVGHLVQYHPCFEAVKKLLASSALGAIQYLYSNRMSMGKIRNEENVIWSLAPHDVSMILSLVHEQPLTVRCHATSIYQNSIADTAHIHLQFKNVNAHIQVSWCNPFKEHKLVVQCERGMLVFDDTKVWEQKLTLYRHQVDASQSPPQIHKAEPENIVVPYAEPLKNECQYFMNVIQGKVKDRTNVDEGIAVLKVLLQTN